MRKPSTTKVYAHRSAVVHGTPGDKLRTIALRGQPWAAADIAVVLLREILTDALTRPGSWTAKTLDTTLLAALGPPADPDETEDADNASSSVDGTDP